MLKSNRSILMLIGLTMVLTIGCANGKDGATGPAGPAGLTTQSQSSTAAQTIFAKWQGYVGGRPVSPPIYANGITDFSIGSGIFGYHILSSSADRTIDCQTAQSFPLGPDTVTLHTDSGFEIEGKIDEGTLSFYSQNYIVSGTGACANVPVGYQSLNFLTLPPSADYTFSVANNVLTICDTDLPRVCADYNLGN